MQFCKQLSLKLTAKFVVLSGVFWSLSGCGSSSPSESQKNNKELKSIIAEQGLTGNPATGRNIPSIHDPKSQLGMKLFYTKALGGDHDAACVTCHHPVLGGGDDLSLPIGVDAELPDLLGPGRMHSMSGEHFDGGPTVPRNAPTTFNVALWDKVLFHDGRVESLGGTQGLNGDDGMGIRTPDSVFGVADTSAGSSLTIAQARFPVTSKEEMKNFSNLDGTNNSEVRENLEQRLGGYGDPLGGALVVNDWLEEFQAGFESDNGTAEELITFENITEAIASYESSQVFVMNPWKAFVEGNDDALTDSEKRGALLFFNSSEKGGANCASCHSGDFFTDESFHVLAMPQIGRGKGNGEGGTNDFGRFRETGDENDKFAFRTPSLLNVEVTGPWGHAGAYTTLEAVVRHHLNPQAALDNYDILQISPNIQAVNLVENTQAALDKLAANRANGIPSIENIELSDEQVNELVAFLRTLTDPCVTDRSCLSPWIPNAADSNPDTMRLNAVNENGDYL